MSLFADLGRFRSRFHEAAEETCIDEKHVLAQRAVSAAAPAAALKDHPEHIFEPFPEKVWSGMEAFSKNHPAPPPHAHPYSAFSDVHFPQ